MRRKIINCINNCENILLDTKTFSCSFSQQSSPDFGRFSSLTLRFHQSTIENMCVFFCRKFWSLKEEKIAKSWKRKDWKRRQKKSCENLARIFRNASERNFREIFLEFSSIFCALQSAPFGNDQEFLRVWSFTEPCCCFFSSRHRNDYMKKNLLRSRFKCGP